MTTLDFYCSVMDFDPGAKLFQGDFGMVSRLERLGDKRAAAGVKPREQNGRFHLRTGYRQPVFNGFKAVSTDRERQEVVFTSCDRCAKLSQWFDNPPHRALPQ
jgi:hypothetical protein